MNAFIYVKYEGTTLLKSPKFTKTIAFDTCIKELKTEREYAFNKLTEEKLCANYAPKQSHAINKQVHTTDFYR